MFGLYLWLSGQKDPINNQLITEWVNFFFYCCPMHFLSVKNLLIPLSSGCISTKNPPFFRKYNYVSGCIKIRNLFFVRIMHSYQKSKYSDRYKCKRTKVNDQSISYLSSFIKFTRISYVGDTINIKSITTDLYVHKK